MGPILTVFDDFYPDPDLIRNSVLSEKFSYYPVAKNKRNYGYNGTYYKPEIKFRKMLMDKISSLMNKSIAYDLEGQGHFRLLNKKQEGSKKTSIHVDHVGWSGVLSLIPPTLPQGSTSFWLHRQTGLVGVHDANKILEAQERLGKDFKGIDTKESQTRSSWKKLMEIGYQYNRLILFNGNLFHSSAPGFGTRKENSKLTQVFFFFEKGQEPKHLGIKWTYSKP